MTSDPDRASAGLDLDAIVALDNAIAASLGAPLSINQSSALRSAWRRCARTGRTSYAALVDELRHHGANELATAVRDVGARESGG